MELNKKSTFADQKNWFESNMDRLPDTLAAPGAFYHNVKTTARMYISNVEREIRRLGPDVKKSADAKASKANLFRLYTALQDESKWNAPKPTRSQFNNYHL